MASYRHIGAFGGFLRFTGVILLISFGGQHAQLVEAKTDDSVFHSGCTDYHHVVDNNLPAVSAGITTCGGHHTRLIRMGEYLS